MIFYAICISWALCVITGANGFTAYYTSKTFVSDGRGPAVNANRMYGPEDGTAALLESRIHVGECPCCVTTPGIGVSPRAARIEIPLRVLFASATFAAPALAEEALTFPDPSVKSAETEALKPAEKPEVEETETLKPAEKPKVEETKTLKPAEKPKVVEIEAAEKSKAEEVEALKPAEKPEVEKTEALKPAEKPKVEEPEALKPAEKPKVEEPEALKPAEKPKVEESEALKPAEKPEVEKTEALKPAEKPKVEEPVAEEPKAEEPKPPAEPKPAPPPKTFEEALEKYFPKALPALIVAAKVQTALSKRKFTRSNTLFGTSICPDEINNKPTKSLPAALQLAMLDFNGIFHLGGLAGLPYMGTSGMKAFLSHCPMNGKVFIMYGPHVGITEEGIVGKVERVGKKIPSLDCDTTLKALEIAQSPPEKTSKPYSLDKREEYIVANLRNALNSGEGAKLSEDALPAFATYAMFDLAKEQILKQLQACLKDDAMGHIDEIVLLGGITVNRGQRLGSIEPREDYFEPLVFDSYSKPTFPPPPSPHPPFTAMTVSLDLYQPVFGAKVIPFYAM